MSAAGVAGIVSGAASGAAGIVGSILQARAIKKAARKAIQFENLKFREFFEDSIRTERQVVASQSQQFAASGIDFRSGSPLAVAVDTANEFARGVARERISMEFRKQQIRAEAKAGKLSSIMSGIGSGLNATSSILGQVNSNRSSGPVSSSVEF